MRTRLFAALSLCLILSATGRPGAQSFSRMTLVKANRLLDPRTGNVLSPAAVLIEERKIKEVGAPTQIERSAPAGAMIIDLGNAMLLPGLFDSHTHLFLDIILPPEMEMQRHYNSFSALGELLAIVESPTKRAFLGAQMAREDLESGITTVRNLGHSGIDGDTELRDAINAGRITGPRIVAAGRKLITRGGYLRNLNPALAEAILQQEFLFIDGVDQARAAVRQNGFQNVDVIKVTAEENLTRLELARSSKRHITSTSELPSTPLTLPAFRPRSRPAQIPSSTVMKRPASSWSRCVTKASSST